MDLMGLMVFCPKNSPEQIRFIRLDLFFFQVFQFEELVYFNQPSLVFLSNFCLP